MAKKSGIYTITHVASGRQYVGQAAHIRDRWLWHKSALRRGQHSNRYLQNAWNKYGEDSFRFELIEECEPTDAALCAREQHWIDTLQPAFNIAPVAGTTRGVKHPPRTAEFREKMREMRKGFRHSQETIEKLRKIQRDNPFKPTKEHIEKLRSANTGRKLSPEHIEKSRQANLGRKHTPEHIAKRVAKLIGHTVSDYTKQRAAEVNRARLTGTKQSKELVEKRIAPLRGRPRDPALIASLHEALRKSRAEANAPLKAIIAANLHLPVTELCKLVGRSFKPTSRMKKEVLCHLAKPNANAEGALDFRRKAAGSSQQHSAPRQQLSLPLG